MAKKSIKALEKSVRDVSLHLFFSLQKQFGHEKAKRVMTNILKKIINEFEESGEHNGKDDSRREKKGPTEDNK